MEKLGVSGNPIRFRVNSEKRMIEMTAICKKHNWIFIGGIEEDVEEDISEVEYMLKPKSFKKRPKMKHPTAKTIVNTEPAIGRNSPCPCGSGKKYKKCCAK